MCQPNANDSFKTKPIWRDKHLAGHHWRQTDDISLSTAGWPSITCGIYQNVEEIKITQNTQSSKRTITKTASQRLWRDGEGRDEEEEEEEEEEEVGETEK